MNKIDLHILAISVFLFIPVVILASHSGWVLLPWGLIQFPIVTRWVDRRRNGEAVAYLVTNEVLILVIVAISALEVFLSN